MDFGSIAEWVQVLAIAGTGFAAVRIADRQLGAFNKNERVRNSLKVLDGFKSPTFMLGYNISPFEAAADIMRLAESPVENSRFKQLRDIHRSGRQSAPLAANRDWFMRYGAELEICRNFFIDIKSAIDEGLIEPRLVLARTSGIIKATVDAMDSLNDGRMNLTVTHEVAAEALRLYRES